MIRSDSQLLVNQMNGKWEVKAPLIAPLYKLAKDLATGLNYRIDGFHEKKTRKQIS